MTFTGILLQASPCWSDDVNSTKAAKEYAVSATLYLTHLFLSQQFEHSGLTNEEIGDVAKQVSVSWSSCTIDQLGRSKYPESESLVDLLASGASIDEVVRVFNQAEEDNNEAFLNFYQTESLACFYVAAQENGVTI